MQDEHRMSIQNNFTSLVEQTDLDLMVATLYEKGVFSEQMIEPYKDTNKDVRSRKRQLYMDITRRGPRAFGHLLDALSENGCWDMVRALDPNSALHSRRQKSPISIKSNTSNYISISTEKGKTKAVAEASKSLNVNPPHVVLAPIVHKDLPDPSAVPHFNVIKSSKFIEEDGKDKLYYTRGNNRGIVFVFSYVQFENQSESYRFGAEVDFAKLKYLFTEMGFKVLHYLNLKKDETLETLDSIKKVVGKEECVFVVVSSHGYERFGSFDTDIRCSDGLIISVNDIFEYFNNKNLPALRGVPKVFIFQLCRGDNADYVMVGDEAFATDGTPSGGPMTSNSPGPRYQPRKSQADRLYSDILIAHSTIPGFVSHRDPLEGSWYIQALCEVFAERAHDCHIEKLFTLVDEKLHHKFKRQTSSIEKRGFNSLLYLHPGLYEDS